MKIVNRMLNTDNALWSCLMIWQSGPRSAYGLTMWTTISLWYEKIGPRFCGTVSAYGLKKSWPPSTLSDHKSWIWIQIRATEPSVILKQCYEGFHYILEYIVDIVKHGFEMSILLLHQANIPHNLVTTYGCFPFSNHHPDYLKWQYYSLGDGLAILNGEPPNKSITWFLMKKSTVQWQFILGVGVTSNVCVKG